jgi:transcriptional regulator with XRE-family HTH domain
MLNIVESEFAAALGVRVRTLRMQRALSQQELAARADLSRQVVAAVERGLHLARPHSIRKIARALGVPVSELTLGISE